MPKLTKVINNYAFIDSQNLNLGVNSQGWKLDFARFRVYLKDKYNVQKAFLFIGHISSNLILYQFLNKSGYELIFKNVLEFKKGNRTVVKGNVDAELVLHTMIEFNNFDKAVIVSGDGDFYCLIEYLLKEKKLEKLLIPNRKKYSALLRKFDNKVDYMNELESKLGKRNKNERD